MRTLLRTRKQLTRERSRHTQRIHKTLEAANIKLDAVLADVLGKSGRAMLDAMVAGESDPERLAALAHKGVKCPPERLREALRGRIKEQHRFLLATHLGLIDAIDAAIARMDQQVEASLAPFQQAVELVSTISGREGAFRARHCLRDRHRHEPLSERGPSVVVGRHVSA